MNKKTKKNAVKSKGPGAPKKAVRYPNGRFTVASVVAINKGTICALTVRNRVAEDLKSKRIVQVEDKPQAGGKVGRPQHQFVLATLAKTLKPVKAPASPAQPRKPKKAPAQVVTLTPVATVTAEPPKDNVDVNPAPTETVTANEPKVIAEVVPAPLP